MDLYKLIYQAAMVGAEHAVSDEAVARKGLLEEIRNLGSGIEVESELSAAGGASLLDLSHRIVSGLTQAMGFEPAFHPDMAALWLPDLDQF